MSYPPATPTEHNPLTDIAAEQTHGDGRYPDWETFNVAAAFAQDTLERLTDAEL